MERNEALNGRQLMPRCAPFNAPLTGRALFMEITAMFGHSFALLT